MRPALFFVYVSQSILVAATAFTEELCKTRLGQTSVQNVPSTTETFSVVLTAYKQVCSTQINTVTPPPTTTTVTTTLTSTVLTTAPQNTDTVTITNTGTITTIETDSITITTTATVTTEVVSTPTSTVPTPAGFTPVSGESSYKAKKKRDPPGRLAPRGKALVTSRVCGGGKGQYSPPVYPSAVECLEFIESITTKTITKNCHITSCTTLTPVTATSTVTDTTTVTSTVSQPDATSTVTASTTVTTSTTTTLTSTDAVTTTVTTTSVAPSATFYAACASNNIVGSANGGQGIEEIIYNNGNTNNQVVPNSATNAYDCCVQCQLTANCLWSDFLFGGCELVIGSTCNPASGQGTSFVSYSGVAAGQGFILSNGPCGQIPDGGSAG